MQNGIRVRLRLGIGLRLRLRFDSAVYPLHSAFHIYLYPPVEEDCISGIRNIGSVLTMHQPHWLKHLYRPRTSHIYHVVLAAYCRNWVWV